ncbi:MAG: flagellar biosynthesis protein FlhA [Deltaproteobacteria bacterium]|nr:MAG: flagellar biosynthesis protein FlhA [Deltaproteobacteria bacterium]
MASENKTQTDQSGSAWLGLRKESSDFFLILALASIVMLMVIPLPPIMLDIFLVFSMTISLMMLLISFYAQRPLEFSAFPTLLLFATLLRLTLNIASTRLILLNGAQGEAAAGQVIRAFGYFIIGGNYVVGLIVFIILIVINFVVITKGAGRIAEVAARFTLDAMPGKQLAIDADLNAGIINDKEALRRREELQKEADFYGSMDGASKFVRGDAIAGILITVVNIVGGFIIGVIQEGLPLVQAAKVYTVLSIGDGLVSQIPSLIVSTAAGLIVTKVSKKERLSEEISAQAFGGWRPMLMASVILTTIGIVPGLPHIPFLLFGSIAGYSSYRIWTLNKKKTLEDEIKAAEAPREIPIEQSNTVPPLDLLEVEVGYDLVPIVDQKSGGELPARIVGIRKQIAGDMGVIVPPVHIRDNLKLRPTEYRIYLKGAVIGQGEILPNHHLALDPGNVSRPMDGIPTKDPTFGLPALWIPDSQKEAAIVGGYTVVDLPSVMATHLSELIKKNLHELLNRQELSKLLDQLKVTHPKVISDLIPDLLSVGAVNKVLQNLLREQISIRDLLTIMETLSDHAPRTKDVGELTEYVRMSLGRNISQKFVSNDKNLYAITLARPLEEKLIKSISNTQTGPQLALDPNLAKTVVEQLGQETKKHVANNMSPVLLTSQQLRPHLQRLLEKFLPDLSVLAHSEVAGFVPVKPIGLIGEPA